MNCSKREFEILEELKKFEKVNGTESLLTEWEEKTLSLNSCLISFYFAKLNGKHANEHADIVLKSGDLEAIYELSRCYPKHANYIINSHDFDYNFKIVERLFEKGINSYEGYSFSVRDISKKISKHVEAMTKSINISEYKSMPLLTRISIVSKWMSFLEWYYANIERKVQVFKRSFGGPYKWDEDGFYYNCDEVGLYLLKESNKYIDTFIKSVADLGDIKDIYSLYSMIKDKSNKKRIEPLRKAIVESLDVGFNYKIIGDYICDEERFKQHDEVIIESKDPEYNYLMAKEYSNSDVSRHLEVVLESKIPKYNFLCAANIRKADKLKHSQVVLESKDLKYILELALRFPDDPLFNDYVDIIKNSGDEEYIARLSELKPFMIEDIKKKIKEFRKNESN